MARYCVNRKAQTNGDHEVHISGCTHPPDAANEQYLGNFTNCHDAVHEAKRYYDQVNGCYHCSPACHTQ